MTDFRRVRRAALLAASCGLVHTAFTVYWAFGGTWLLWALGARVASAFEGRLWLLWPGVVVKFLAAVVPALVLRSQRRPSRWLLGAMWTAAVVLIAWGGANTVVGNLVLSGVVRPDEGFDREGMIGHAWLWDPLFLAWGLALAVALHARRRADKHVR